MGLSIIRRLVELMQGSITIDSAVGRGTTMRVELTLAISEQSPSGHADFALPAVTPQAAPADVALPAAAKLATKKINDSLQVLAVDDNPVNRMLLERQLALLGMRVETAEDGQEAFEKWRDGNFDMIVSDIHMPGMDGYGLARAVRLREAEHSLPRIPMLAWSASVLTDTYDNCILAGMDDLLLKPATLAQLKVAIAKWLPEAIPQALQKA